MPRCEYKAGAQIRRALTRYVLHAASQAGLLAFNGLGMLVEQAALSLENWIGIPVPRQLMRQAVPEFSGFASPFGSDLPLGNNRPMNLPTSRGIS